MANAKRNRRKNPKKGFDPTNTQVISYVLIGVGVAYLLSLVSYTPNDVPGRLPFSGTSNLNTPPENFFGRLGAIAAGFSYWVIGAAGYLVPACLIWFGVAKLLFGARTSRRSLLGFGMVMLSACCLLQFQTWFFSGWPDVYNIPGAGGLLGYGLGAGLFATLLGTLGAFLVMVVVYFTGVTMVTGFHPVHFGALCYDGVRRWADAREERRIQEADGARRLVLQKRKLEREQRRLEKKIGRSGVELPAAGAAKIGRAHV